MLYNKIINKLYKMAFNPPNFNRTIKSLFDNQKELCFLDVGANKGQPIDWASNLFEKIEIFSFEPTKILFQHLVSKYRNNDHVRLFKLALSNNNGTTKFYTSSNSMTNSLLKPKMDLYKKYIDDSIFDKMNLQFEETVEVTRLDDWYKKNINNKIIDILKIDVQGNDYNVLLGAEPLLQNNIRVIIIEIEYLVFYEGAAPFYKIIELLMNYGFYVYSIFDNTRLPNNQLVESNFIFVKDH